MTTDDAAPADHQATGEPDLKVGAQKTWAAGIPGVVHALEHVVEQPGIRRGVAALRVLNQPGGLDCPGCAWPEPHDRSHFEFCENGAKAVADDATRRTVTAAFFAQHPIADLAERTDHWLNQQGRLVAPMHRAPEATHYEPIEWDDALDLVASRLAATAPERVVFYTSGRASNEAAFMLQLLARALGTNNLPDCSNMCHESSGVALTETIGIGKGTVTIDDFERAQLIIVMGQNPGTNHPRMLAALEGAKRAGATIVAINPLAEPGLTRFKNPQTIRGVVGRGTALADHTLPVRIGGDLALMQYVNRRLVERGAVGTAFVDEYCDGFDSVRGHLLSLDPAALSAASGVGRVQLDELADLVGRSERIIVCWAMGLTQHRDAVATIREITNMLLLRGAIGKPGAGACPVRGHSNVQGDRTMGIVERPSEAFLERLDSAVGIVSPREPGYDTVEAITAMAAGEVDVFMSLGGNFAAATPDSLATAAALSRVGLTVQISTKLNRSHLDTGREALILPVLGRTDTDDTGGRRQSISVEDSMGIVHRSAGTLKPPSADLHSEIDLIASLGERIPATSLLPWAAWRGDYAAIRSVVERVVPGFEDFERRLDQRDGFALPNGPRDARHFATATGKARLTVNVATPDPALSVAGADGDDVLIMQTLRSHDQFNTTIYGLDDRYRGVTGGRRVVFCNRDDIARLGFADGEVVDIESLWTDGVERQAERFRIVGYDTPVGTCATYFPEANVLVPLGSVADGSRTPTSKHVRVRLLHR